MSKTRDHAKLEKRRLQASKLFAKGNSAPEVARRLGVARQVAYPPPAECESCLQLCIV